MPQLAPWVISSLWFNCCCGAHGAHGLAGSKSDGDLVLVAVLVAGLDADDERHRLALVWSSSCRDVGRRVLRVVGRELTGRARTCTGRRRSVGALHCASVAAVLAHPRLDLRAGEHRAADRVVGIVGLAALPPGVVALSDVGADRRGR